MKAELGEFISFLEKYRDELVVALDNEREKRQALISNDIDRLEALIQAQQAETMKLKNFENKRLALQTKLGLGNCKAKDIVAAAGDKETKEKLETLLDEIVSLVGRIKQQNKMAIELANTNLRVIDKIMRPADTEARNVYGPENSKNNPAYSIEPSFEKMV